MSNFTLISAFFAFFRGEFLLFVFFVSFVVVAR